MNSTVNGLLVQINDIEKTMFFQVAAAHVRQRARQVVRELTIWQGVRMPHQELQRQLSARNPRMDGGMALSSAA
jgi:hypothetical protein